MIHVQKLKIQRQADWKREYIDVKVIPQCNLYFKKNLPRPLLPRPLMNHAVKNLRFSSDSEAYGILLSYPPYYQISVVRCYLLKTVVPKQKEEEEKEEEEEEDDNVISRWNFWILHFEWQYI